MAIRRKSKAAPKGAAAAARPARAALSEISKRVPSWGRPSEVLSPVRAVSTIFPAVDAAIGCGGLPLERYVLVHGPSGAGKSQLALGFGLSFLEGGHVFGLIEPEATTPFPWVKQLFAAHADSERFFAARPGCYEEAVDQTRELLLGVKALREKGKLPKKAAALIVCDAITKLAPKSLIERLLAEGGSEKAGVDGMSGSGGRYIASLNAAWTRELTGLLYQTGSTFVAVARERVNQEPRGRRYVVTGGNSLMYEASVAIRVSYRKPVKVGERVVGTRHFVDVMKLKVSDDTVERAEAFFHTSNGLASPAGFDRARDVWELALETRAARRFKRKGSVGYETFDGELLPDSVEACVARLREDSSMMAALEVEGRRRGSEQKGKSDDLDKASEE